MHRIDTMSTSGFFEVGGGTERSQAATMTLASGQSTGRLANAHAASDQWLSVVSGTGTATVEGNTCDLGGGTLVLIKAGEAHEITNTGPDPLEPINVYAPPDY